MNRSVIKCSNCGSTNFESYQPIDVQITEGYIGLSFNTYVCKNCGHLEFFDKNLDQHAKQEELAKELFRKKEEMMQKEKEEKRQKEIEEARRVVEDDSSTVKEVNAALAKLSRLGAPYGKVVIEAKNIKDSSPRR